MAVIPYTDVVKTERLPVDAQDVASTVNLVIAGNRAGPEPSMFINFETLGEFPAVQQAVSYAARPLTYKYVQSNTLGAVKSVGLPEGITPFLAPTDSRIPEPQAAGGFTNPGSPSAVRDGDMATYASTSSGGMITYPSVPKAVGFRLVYTASESGHVAMILNPSVAPVTTWVAYDVAPATAPAEMVAVMLLDARTAPDNQPGVVVPPTPPYGVLEGAPAKTQLSLLFVSGSAQVHEFYPLIPDETLLESIAVNNVRLPASNPRRVTVTGYVPPDREVTITGWPGGDLTAQVAQVQYELGRTVIDLEQAGAPLGLPAEAVEAARERRVAIERAVSEAAYPVRMGERQ